MSNTLHHSVLGIEQDDPYVDERTLSSIDTSTFDFAAYQAVLTVSANNSSRSSTELFPRQKGIGRVEGSHRAELSARPPLGTSATHDRRQNQVDSRDRTLGYRTAHVHRCCAYSHESRAQRGLALARPMASILYDLAAQTRRWHSNSPKGCCRLFYHTTVSSI